MDGWGVNGWMDEKKVSHVWPVMNLSALFPGPKT
jgi:hypothetical protein